MTPSTSRRRSKWWAVAWCSWTTNTPAGTPRIANCSCPSTRAARSDTDSTPACEPSHAISSSSADPGPSTWADSGAVVHPANPAAQTQPLPLAPAPPRRSEPSRTDPATDTRTARESFTAQILAGSKRILDARWTSGSNNCRAVSRTPAQRVSCARGRVEMVQPVWGLEAICTRIESCIDPAEPASRPSVRSSVLSRTLWLGDSTSWMPRKPTSTPARPACRRSSRSPRSAPCCFRSRPQQAGLIDLSACNLSPLSQPFAPWLDSGVVRARPGWRLRELELAAERRRCARARQRAVRRHRHARRLVAVASGRRVGRSRPRRASTPRTRPSASSPPAPASSRSASSTAT